MTHSESFRSCHFMVVDQSLVTLSGGFILLLACEGTKPLANVR